MTAIVEGFYKQGKIDLLDPPPGLPEGRVWVIVLVGELPQQPPRYLTLGKYQIGRMSTLEDFGDAEWRGEREFHDPHAQ
jgi:hypothetical protein